MATNRQGAGYHAVVRKSRTGIGGASRKMSDVGRSPSCSWMVLWLFTEFLIYCFEVSRLPYTSTITFALIDMAELKKLSA